MSRKILVIENDPEDRLRIREGLEKNDFQVIEAASKKEGIQQYIENHPEAILVRLMMEDMDTGIEINNTLRQLNNKAPVFLMSRVANFMDGEVDYLKMGFTALIQKPVDCNVLVRLLKQSLG
jgi:CheY-like chemotaxis protein